MKRTNPTRIQHLATILSRSTMSECVCIGKVSVQTGKIRVLRRRDFLHIWYKGYRCLLWRESRSFTKNRQVFAWGIQEPAYDREASTKGR